MVLNAQFMCLWLRKSTSLGYWGLKQSSPKCPPPLHSHRESDEMVGGVKGFYDFKYGNEDGTH